MTLGCKKNQRHALLICSYIRLYDVQNKTVSNSLMYSIKLHESLVYNIKLYKLSLKHVVIE